MSAGFDLAQTFPAEADVISAEHQRRFDAYRHHHHRSRRGRNICSFRSRPRFREHDLQQV